jgi:hypothetical protein
LPFCVSTWTSLGPFRGPLTRLEGVDQVVQVVSVDGTDVAEPQLLEDHPGNQEVS